jgi:hypothetical protein
MLSEQWETGENYMRIFVICALYHILLEWLNIEGYDGEGI